MNELIGAELDLAVALAVQGDLEISPRDIPDITDWYIPSQSWKQGGPLIEEYGIALIKFEHREGIACDPYWIASWTGTFDSFHYKHHKEGPTPLIAAMRALVASQEVK